MAVSGEVQLGIYNGALWRLGSRKIGTLTENRESRRVMDSIWDNERVVREALERGDWNFALKSVKLTHNPSIETEFGYQYAFDKPDDFRRMSSMSADEYFSLPLTNRSYADEGAFWLSDIKELYLRYVSSHTDYGLDSSRWSEAFRTYLECKMAVEACERITKSTALESRIEKKMEDALKQAKSNDAMSEGPKMRPPGRWVRSRTNGYIRNAPGDLA